MAPATKRRKVASAPHAANGLRVPVAPSHASAAGISSYGRISRSSAVTVAGKAQALKNDSLSSNVSAARKKQTQQLSEADESVLNRIASFGSNDSASNKKDGARLKRKNSGAEESDNNTSKARKAVKVEKDGSQVKARHFVKIEDEQNEDHGLPPTIVVNVTPDTPSTKAARSQLEAFKITSSPLQKSPSRWATNKTRSSGSSSVKKEPPSSNSLAVSSLSSSPSLPTPCPKKRRRDDTLASREDIEEELPAEIQDLLSLHGCFLTSLSLHYAHQGTAVPVDLRTLGATVARSWGRRAVDVDDVRRLLGVQQRAVADPAAAALLSLWDYGRGKTCIEYCAALPATEHLSPVKKEEEEEEDDDRPKHKIPSRKTNGVIACQPPLDASSLKYSFAWWIREQWRTVPKSESSDGSCNAADFIAGLPLARLHRRATSRAAKSVLLSKGEHTELTKQLRAGAATRCARDAVRDGQVDSATGNKSSAVNQQSPVMNSSIVQASVSVPTQNKPGSQQRGASLLDRIRAKEAQLAATAAQAAGPTAEQLVRRAALQRVPEVISVLAVLASNSGTSTSSFSYSGAQPYIGRSGITPSSALPLTQRMSSVSLSGGSMGSSDDALLAALDGSSKRAADKKGLAGMFGKETSTTSSPRPSALETFMSSGSRPQSMAPSSASSSTAVSMSLAQVIERVQCSLRTPVARPEIENVLRVIACDVAPEWLRIRSVGSVCAVAIGSNAPAGHVWRERVDVLLRGC